MSAADLFEESDILDDERTDETARPPRASIGAVVIPVLALAIAVYLEVALAIDARVLGVVPDLALIVVVALALRFGSIAGAVAGFAAGLLLDVAVQGPLGASALVLTPLGWAAGWWAQRRRRVSLGMAIAVLLVATGLAVLGDAIVTVAIDGQSVGWGGFAVRAVASTALTVLLGIPLLALLRRVMGVPEEGSA